LYLQKPLSNIYVPFFIVNERKEGRKRDIKTTGGEMGGGGQEEILGMKK
jgi:hypothetical protein